MDGNPDVLADCTDWAFLDLYWRKVRLRSRGSTPADRLIGGGEDQQPLGETDSKPALGLVRGSGNVAALHVGAGNVGFQLTSRIWRMGLLQAPTATTTSQGRQGLKPERPANASDVVAGFAGAKWV